jgi:cation:H+ antiporter
MALVAGPRSPMIGWIAIHSVLFLAVYLFAIRTIFTFERARMRQITEQMTGEIRYRETSLRRAGALFAAAAAVLVVAATYLPGIAEQIAISAGLTESFVGSVLVAGSTSLPEVAVSIAAARIGALDLAAGNLFGSNVFNVAVLGIDDALYTRGSMLAVVAPGHLLSTTGAIVMTAIAIIGLTYRAGRKRYTLSWDAIAMLIVYGVVVALLRAGA